MTGLAPIRLKAAGIWKAQLLGWMFSKGGQIEHLPVLRCGAAFLAK